MPLVERGDLETAQTEIEANWAVSTMQNEV